MSTVLVADDDADIRELVTFKLEQEGHEVHAVADGEAARRAVLDVSPDIVLLDVMMPRRTGLEVCEALRAAPETAGLPVGWYDSIRSLGASCDQRILPVARSRQTVKSLRR